MQKVQIKGKPSKKKLLAEKVWVKHRLEASLKTFLTAERVRGMEGGLNVSAFFLGHLSVIFERDGLGGGVCIDAAVDGGVWINGEGGAVGDGLSASVGGGGKGGAGVFIEVEEELM